MYKLVQYYELNDSILYHLVTFADTEEEINKTKVEIAKELNDVGIETLEIIATKNIKSLKKILKRDDVQIFQVLKE
jgi:uncharacterized protein Smg (DUF494 family)